MKPNHPIHKPTPAGGRLLARVIGTRWACKAVFYQTRKEKLMYKLSSMLFLMALSASALGGTPLSGEQIKQLISGNTVSLHSNAKGIDYKIYYATDGTAISHNERNGKNYKGTWRITDSGEWCNHWPPAEDRCGQVIDNGDGTYNRMEGGSMRSVWKKIYPGNTIPE